MQRTNLPFNWRTTMPRSAFIFLVMFLILPLSAYANGDDEPINGNDEFVISDDDLAAARGFVETNCARCHAIASEGESPFEAAPPLRDIGSRYAIEGLAEAFAEGIVVGHAAMPEFELEPEEIDMLLDYLTWLAE